MSELGSAIEAILRACDRALRASTIESLTRTPEAVRVLLDAGEDVVAYEILCNNLYEDDVEVPRALLLALGEAAHRAGASARHIEPLLG